MGTAGVPVHDEVERIKGFYSARDQNADLQRYLRPFEENVVRHRVQQYVVMADLFRAAGRYSLEGLKILDVGCGDGRLLRAFLDWGAEPCALFGVDLRPDAIERARRLSPNITYRLTGGADLPFPDGEFHLVTQFVCFSSVFLPALRARLAEEMVRVLRPGGYIFWWDCNHTLDRARPEPLRPADLFGGMLCASQETGIFGRPSASVRLPFRLRKWARFFDRLAFPNTHTGALIGPKPGPREPCM